MEQSPDKLERLTTRRDRLTPPRGGALRAEAADDDMLNWCPKPNLTCNIVQYGCTLRCDTIYIYDEAGNPRDPRGNQHAG